MPRVLSAAFEAKGDAAISKRNLTTDWRWRNNFFGQCRALRPQSKGNIGKAILVIMQCATGLRNKGMRYAESDKA